MSNEDLQFVCPLCGGHYWGTSGIMDTNPKGHCHDQFGKGCKFTWERFDEDRYFKPRISTEVMQDD